MKIVSKHQKQLVKKKTSSGSAIHVPACLINRFEPLALEKNVSYQTKILLKFVHYSGFSNACNEQLWYCSN